jgi:hypothetical protein
VRVRTSDPRLVRRSPCTSTTPAEISTSACSGITDCRLSDSSLWLAAASSLLLLRHPKVVDSAHGTAERFECSAHCLASRPNASGAAASRPERWEGRAQPGPTGVQSAQPELVAPGRLGRTGAALSSMRERTSSTLKLRFEPWPGRLSQLRRAVNGSCGGDHRHTSGHGQEIFWQEAHGCDQGGCEEKWSGDKDHQCW